ncbi:DUF4124 domain-containing protein [Gilvimarinus algae]|uniref:DUF4124 domain-containing protein n=1 Tax=Gilvimarinus algae TaxID=3058037 RepID=A0ABT8TCF5_9GAMM|nr:DUF4124 domain-containing protein [Gilvimarinus sp. SDUM040014]MDO3381053.1 DUF4124 domain-containing protein [Gilvimarinus sp. SDUM040014]
MSWLQTKQWLPVLLSGICCSAGAQVYTWTDDKGKVHFSDQRRAENAEAQQIDIGTMPAAPLIETSDPATYNGQLYPLIVDRFFYADSVSDEQRPLITFYFGGDCVSPTSQNFNQLRTRYTMVLRDESKLQADVFRALRTRAYGNVYRTGHYNAPDVDTADVRYLNGEITSLKINACRTNLPPGISNSDLDGSLVTQFDLVNAWLEVKWTLSSRLDGEPMAEFTTRGVAATRLDSGLRLGSAVRVAFETAIDNLQSEDAWRQAVTQSARGEPETASGAPGVVTANGSAPYDFQQRQLQQAQQRSAFVAALAELSAVRMAIAEYYQVRGVMPLSMSAIGFERGPQTRSRHIESMHMQAPGVVHAVLPETALPGGHYIELIPEVEQGFTLLEWRCVTSVALNTASGCESL